MTSGSTTSGRVVTIANATTNTMNQEINIVGRALSAATTANTNAGLLVYVKKWF